MAFNSTAYGLSTPRGEDWRERAACLGIDPEVFHPISERMAVDEAALAEAKATCAICPVRRDCLSFALDVGDRWGVYGGFTADERRLKFGGQPRPDRAAPVRCRRGRHWMTGENVYVDEHRHRHCRACRAETQRAARKRHELVTS
jgi:WhiB family redox-sensing transcriptional regulator